MYPSMYPIISMYPLNKIMHPRVHHAPRLTITALESRLVMRGGIGRVGAMGGAHDDAIPEVLIYPDFRSSPGKRRVL